MVIARLYEDIAEAMEAEAAERIENRGSELVETVYAPGVYDSPLAADRLASSDAVDTALNLTAARP